MHYKSPVFLLLIVLCLFVGVPPCRGQKGSFAKVEISFQLPGITGNPFDFTQNDVRCTFTLPDKTTQEVPAFFDGGQTWRVRFTPRSPGKYVLAKVTRNREKVAAQAMDRKSFTVSASKPTGPGFVRIDPKDKTRFVFDSGAAYYPLGHNVAWKSGDTPDVAAIFDKMGKTGENWSRVWMNHWDNKNLDWAPGAKNEPGTYSLEVARRWDGIVDAAEKNGIYFQMVLQHHGQYSSQVNPNWGENPWNTANGGFLATPEEFFTDPRARALTKAKYRYILARWGHSPAVLAWELFNEVEWVDAIRNKKEDTVAAWHREMAVFLRAQDTYGHLVTTSSDRKIPGLYAAMDFVQPHGYPVDPVSTVTAVKAEISDRRPIFYGEIGPGGDLMAEDGSFLHNALWASLMSESSGAAQYWTWDLIDRKNLYSFFASAAGFLKATGLGSRAGLRTVSATVTTSEPGAVSFGPGGGWGEAKQTEFTIPASGNIAGIGEMPSFLQGQAHRAMFPAATFHVDYKQAGTFVVRVRQSSKAGGNLVVKVDGATVAERAFPAAESDTSVDAVVEAKMAAGKHVVRLENTGADWVVIQRITLAPYGSALSAVAKASADSAALWVYPARDAAIGPSAAPPPITTAAPGTVTIPGLGPGLYRVIRWDTRKGIRVGPEMVTVTKNKSLSLTIPAGKDSLAIFAARER